MDALIEILYLLSNWRLVLSLVASIFVALILSSTFQWFTAGYCITLVLCGTRFGILWQGRSEAGLSLSDPMVGGSVPKLHDYAENFVRHMEPGRPIELSAKDAS